MRLLTEQDQVKKRNYFLKNYFLIRLCHSITISKDEKWLTLEQIVVPTKYRLDVLGRAHENVFSGHFGISKTLKRIQRKFCWPGIKKDVVAYCRSCHSCQLVGKSNQVVPKAPLHPIPSVGEPFEQIIIDVVGPLPKSSSGCEYLLTIMDRTTRYPEAIPLRSIKSPIIIKHLFSFFSRFGLPKSIQSDQGTNFTSHYFQKEMKALGINHIVSTAYHPESQGAIERFHQTLKSMFKKFCLEKKHAWDKELPFSLFAVRSIPDDSLGLSPF